MKTTLFVISALLMLNVYSKAKVDESYLYRTYFKVDKIAITIPSPGTDYVCGSEASLRKNKWCAPKPDLLVALYCAIGGKSFQQARAKTGITIEEMYPASNVWVKVLKDDIKRDCSLEEFKQMSDAATKGLKEIQPWMVNEILYSDGTREELKRSGIVSLGRFIVRDTAFGTVTIALNEKNLYVFCTATVLVKGRVLHMGAKCSLGEASSIKYLMSFTYNWVDATIKANK